VDDDSYTGDSALPSRSPASASFGGMVFGGVTGILVGSLAGIACYWIVGAANYLWDGGINGGLIGLPVGAIIGGVKRRQMGASIESNIATHIGILYGLIPGTLFLLGGIGIVKGKFSVLVVLGAFFGCPTVGMFIGAVLDRIYESFLRPRIPLSGEDEGNRE
jgi:hypothetical protein